MRSNYRLGLIGYPLGHSLSPPIHHAALDALDLEGKYKLFPIPPLPEGKTALSELIQQIRNEEIQGLNVTIPHKQSVIPLLDKLTAPAEAIGAVNTLFQKDDQLIGDNTDAAGFWMDMQRIAGRAERNAYRPPHSALILGAGGSARAVAYSLLKNGFTITIAARRLEQAHAISKQLSLFSDQISSIELSNLQSPTSNFQLIVNTTPVGMHPQMDASPWPTGVPFPKNAAVYDLVYNPRQTALVRQALAAGLPAITGLGMLIEQAALSFERWTGLQPPRKLMTLALESEL